MASRPRRSAAQRATIAITDMADRDNERTMSSRTRRSGGLASVSRGPPSSPASSQADSSQHTITTVKVPSNKLRQATNGSGKRASSGTAAAAAAATRSPYGRAASSTTLAAGKRTRGTKKSYVVESESDEEEEEEEEDEDEEEEEEEEEEDEIEVGNRAGLVDPEEVEDDEEEDDDEEMDEDAEGEEVEEMDVDAEGEDEDADGDVDMDIAPPAPPPAITISRPSKSTAVPAGKLKSALSSSSKPSGRSVALPTARPVVKDDEDDDDDDDDELSELESEPEGVDVGAGEEDAEGEDEEVEDIDAEGEEIEVADEDAEGEDDDELDSDDGSHAGTPDMSKLTARQRAKLGGASHEYSELSNEVQAKKVFTAEELSMRRAEMARRRRNLSEKRNEEVKMETINKLLKKQAPKTTRRNALAGYDSPDSEGYRAGPLFVRWVSTKDGNRVGVPDDMLIGPAGRVFLGGGGAGGRARGKMVEEVS